MVKIPFAPVCRMMMLVVASVAPLVGMGSLHWETREVQITVKPGDSEALASFPFTNTGNATVTITHIQPDCGCTTASVVKQAYAPGEAGVIKVVFALGGRIGLQEKMIQVITDDQSFPPVSLVLRVNIPELVAITPRLLLWPKGGEPVEQSAVVVVADQQKAVAIELSDPKQELYSIRIETVEPGRKYRLFVQPHALAAMTNAPIRCQVRLDDGTVHPFFIYALVR